MCRLSTRAYECCCRDSCRSSVAGADGVSGLLPVLPLVAQTCAKGPIPARVRNCNILQRASEPIFAPGSRDAARTCGTQSQ
jgi:hypothetical protein